jgi:hypothetical protein
MLGMILGGIGTAGTRVVLAIVSISIWLLSRPGGWAVLVVLALLALRWFPEAAPPASPTPPAPP